MLYIEDIKATNLSKETCMTIGQEERLIEIQNKFNSAFKKWCDENGIDLLDLQECEISWTKQDFIKTIDMRLYV